METKFVIVQAEKTKDGKILYRRKKTRHSFGGVVAAWAIVVFGVCVAFGGGKGAPKAIQIKPTIADPAENVVVLSVEPTIVETATPDVDEALVEMLALVIYQEAGGDACSDETRRMVGEVAMNRVEDSRFPDTLEEVLLQKAQYGRLHWTGLVWPDRASLEGEAHAVERAYDIAKIVLSGENQLLPDDVVFQAEFPQGVETVVEADGLYFCR